jgi:hypothetical protein
LCCEKPISRRAQFSLTNRRKETPCNISASIKKEERSDAKSNIPELYGLMLEETSQAYDGTAHKSDVGPAAVIRQKAGAEGRSDKQSGGATFRCKNKLLRLKTSPPTGLS